VAIVQPFGGFWWHYGGCGRGVEIRPWADYLDIVPIRTCADYLDIVPIGKIAYCHCVKTNRPIGAFFMKNDFLKEGHVSEIRKLCNFHNFAPW